MAVGILRRKYCELNYPTSRNYCWSLALCAEEYLIAVAEILLSRLLCIGFISSLILNNYRNTFYFYLLPMFIKCFESLLPSKYLSKVALLTIRYLSDILKIFRDICSNMLFLSKKKSYRSKTQAFEHIQ